MARFSGLIGLMATLGALGGCGNVATSSWHDSAMVTHHPFAGAILTSSSMPPPGLPAQDPLDIDVR